MKGLIKVSALSALLKSLTEIINRANLETSVTVNKNYGGESHSLKLDTKEDVVNKPSTEL